MARTKQTARPSTGGLAPRRRLAGRGPIRYINLGKRQSKQQVISGTPVIPDTGSISHEAISSAAQREALCTPDVLIIILSQLPHSSLLKAQRVSRLWASLFSHVEVQAALFQCPRPKGSALYVETYSNILMDRFSTFWPSNGENKTNFSETSTIKTFHPAEWNKIPVHVSNDDGPSEEVRLQDAAALQSQQQEDDGYQCPYADRWSRLLVRQPPIEALGLIIEVSRRATRDTIEFRGIIPCPDGLRMGLLYDAVRHWHDVEHTYVELLWNRKTGDLITPYQTYEDGPSLKTIEDKPCLTIRGYSSIGCGQRVGLTYGTYSRGDTLEAQVIQGSDGNVEYHMSQPRRPSSDLDLLTSDTEEEEDSEDVD